MKKGLGKCEAIWPAINMKGNKTKWLKEKSEKKKSDVSQQGKNMMEILQACWAIGC